MRTTAMTQHTRADHPAPWHYAWWLVVGGLLGLGIVGIMTIGVFVLPVAVVLAVSGALLPALRNSSAAAAVAGLALPALYLAWLNRSGPGLVCESTGTGTACSETWSPWPFIVVAAVLVMSSITLARVMLRTASPR